MPVLIELRPASGAARIEESHASVFSAEKIGQVVDVLGRSAGRIIPAMYEAAAAAGRPLPEGKAEEIFGGEVARVKGLAGIFYPESYERVLDILNAASAIPPRPSINERGISLGSQWALMDKMVQPGSVIGIDYAPHIVAGARIALEEFEKAGLLDAAKYIVMLGEDIPLPHASLSMQSLVSQYEPGAAGTVDWLMKNAEVGSNFEVCHGPIKISEEPIEDGSQIPIVTDNVPFADKQTGFGLQIESDKLAENPLGALYDYSILQNTELLDEEHSVGVGTHAQRLKGKVYVFEEDGVRYIEPWAWIPTELATNEDMHKLAAMRRTLHDIYRELGRATNGEKVWDAAAPFGIPRYAAEKGMFTTVILTTLPDKPLPSSLPLNIMRRHGAEMAFLHGIDERNRAEAKEGQEVRSHLSQIGPGRVFETLADFYRELGKWVDPNGEFASKFEFVNPPLLTTITTKDPTVFRRIQRVLTPEL